MFRWRHGAQRCFAWRLWPWLRPWLCLAVDFAFAYGLQYLNLKGLGKPERSVKVDRLQEILDELRRRQVEIEREMQ